MRSLAVVEVRAGFSNRDPRKLQGRGNAQEAEMSSHQGDKKV